MTPLVRRTCLGSDNDLDPTQLVALLDGILATGSKPVAILSLLLNFYLWRALRASEKSLMESRLEEIERMRSELSLLRNSDKMMLRQMDHMVNVVKETRPRAGTPSAPKRSARPHEPTD